MNSIAVPIRLPARHGRRRIVLACLLFAAQLLSHLHVLHHLEGGDDDKHDDEVCVLCILGAATDHAGVAEFTSAANPTNGSQPVYIAGGGFTTRSLIAYQGRAPPSSAPIA